MRTIIFTNYYILLIFLDPGSEVLCAEFFFGTADINFLICLHYVKVRFSSNVKSDKAGFLEKNLVMEVCGQEEPKMGPN